MKWRLTKKLMAAGIGLLLAGTVWPVGLFADPPQQEWKAPARAERKKSPIPADAKSIAAGKVVFTAQCFSCHGPAGKGDGPAAKDLNPKPRDLSDQKILSQTDGALFWKISTGRKPMPEFEKLISEDERWHVINYVRTLSPQGGGK
jgi:mono/diheme cytochrome c family protein